MRRNRMNKEVIEKLRSQDDLMLFVVFRSLKKIFVFYPKKITLLLSSKEYRYLPEFSEQTINTHILVGENRVPIMLNYQDIVFIIPYRLERLSLIHTYNDWEAHKVEIDAELIAFHRQIEKLQF